LSKMDINRFLAREKTLIDQALNKFLPSNKKPVIISKAMRYSVFAGGKRLRPILILTTYRAMGGKHIEKAIPAACAVEMIHTYSLIHDDLPAMDDDDFRRGKPSCHKKFGEAIAILAGDALFARSFEILQKTPAKQKTVLMINKELSAAVGIDGIIGGQVMDIISSSDKPDKLTLRYIHTHKTGKFISTCMVLGAILAGAKDDEIEAIRKAGNLLGLSFQIVDDILDVKGTRKTLGKSAHKDSLQKKLTYPALYGIEESRKKTLQLLKKTKTIFDNQLKHRDTTGLKQIAEFIVNRIY